MIGYLRGRVIQMIQDNRLLLDVQGVGYEVHIPARSSFQGDATFFIHTQVREDAITLFGFESMAERTLFLTLTKVPGVGAKVAMNLLAIGTMSQLITAITCGDATYLSRGEGIGPTLAKRLVSELKGKVLLDTRSVITSTSSPAIPQGPSLVGDRQQVLSALVNLGYDESNAFVALETVLQNRRRQGGNDDPALADWIRLCLKQLALPA